MHPPSKKSVLKSIIYRDYVHNEYYYYDLPRLKQQGSFKKVNSFPVVQVTSLLPLLRAPESEQVTSTTVPGSTGNLAAVSIVLVHSAFSIVHPENIAFDD